ncbi:hypothetical protein OESDEN_23046 [Oesophagostomum dentatum]|uniref:Uncharacterized protein n=1 Tax=Oesophagostomum dentatum TaxID=61180 RepID=A0A0B1RXB4_OESDE|nr:hypothetical protein OESDEN_23046 [Oesophagostomum dentatum]
MRNMKKKRSSSLEEIEFGEMRCAIVLAY